MDKINRVVSQLLVINTVALLVAALALLLAGCGGSTVEDQTWGSAVQGAAIERAADVQARPSRGSPSAQAAVTSGDLAPSGPLFPVCGYVGLQCCDDVCYAQGPAYLPVTCQTYHAPDVCVDYQGYCVYCGYAGEVPCSFNNNGTWQTICFNSLTLNLSTGLCH